MKNLIKLVVLCIVITTSYFTSSHFINEKVIEVKEKEETLANLIFKSQVQAKLEEAQKKAQEELLEYQKKKQEELEKENQERLNQGLKPKEEIKEIVIASEKLEMKEPEKKEEKPSKPKKDKDKKKESETEKEIQEIPAEEKDSLVNKTEGDEQHEESEHSSMLPSEDMVVERSITDLSQEEYVYFGNFIVDRYFLDGYIYCELETNEELYEKKCMVRDMEDYMVDSMYAVFDLLQLMMKLDFNSILEYEEEMFSLAQEYKEKYQSVGETSIVYGEIYEFMLGYFEKYLEIVDSITNAVKISQSGNPALTVTVLIGTIEKKVMPAAIELLDYAIDLKEYTNAVYLEGMEEVSLLTKEEVMKCIKNPGYVLYFKEIEEKEVGNEEQQEEQKEEQKEELKEEQKEEQKEESLTLEATETEHQKEKAEK